MIIHTHNTHTEHTRTQNDVAHRKLSPPWFQDKKGERAYIYTDGEDPGSVGQGGKKCCNPDFLGFSKQNWFWV